MTNVVKCFDENNYLSVIVNGEKHFTDGIQHYIEREPGVVEYIGPFSEAHVDVIEAFLTDLPS